MSKLLKNIDHNYEYLIEEFELALEQDKQAEVVKLVKKINVADLSALISDYNSEKKQKFIKLVASKFPSELFLKFHDVVAEEFIFLIGPKLSAKFISKLDPPEVLSILEELHEETREQILSFLPKDLKQELQDGFSYPVDSAGRLMYRNFISVPAHWTVDQANNYCVKNKRLLTEKFYGIFVVDHLFRPIGIVRTKELVINDTKEKISNIMDECFEFNYLTNKSDLAVSFQKYDLVFAPIVNNDGRILGYVSIDDVINVVDESAEEDILHLGGINESDIYAKFGKTIKQRFPWLFVNLLTAIIASFVIGVFDETIKNLVALAILMPIIASMGGNAGTQTVTIAVRALATQQLNQQNALKIIIKEMLVGMANGLFFATICFTAIFFIFSNVQLALLFSLATIITLLVAGLSGAIIPIVIDKLKGDPAVSSSVILTTITDVVAFLAFLGLAKFFI